MSDAEEKPTVYMTDEQFSLFRADQIAHLQIVQEHARQQMEHARRCADYAADPKPPIALRDWFAGQALAGDMVATDQGCFPNDVADDHLIARAKLIYRMADAMLAAREATQ